MRTQTLKRKLNQLVTMRSLACAAVGAIAVTAATTASAQVYTWNGGSATNSNWSQTTNWNGGIRPISNYLAEINFSGTLRKSNVNDLGTLRMGKLYLFGNSWWLSGNPFEFQGGGLISSLGTSNLISNNLIFNLNGANADVSVNAAGSNNLTLGGTISGAGRIKKVGSGLLSINGAMNNAGGLWVNEGTVNINQGPNSGALLVDAAGALNWSVSGTQTFGQLITNAGTITKSGGGTLTYNGGNQAGGLWRITGGTLIAGQGSIGGNVAFDSISGSNFTMDVDSLNFMNGNVSAAQAGHTFAKTGAGNLVMNGSVDDNIFVNVLEGSYSTDIDGMTNSMAVAAGATILQQVDDGLTHTIFSNVTGAGTFMKAGFGTLVATNPWNFGGLTSIFQGTFRGSSTTLLSDIDVSGNGILEYQQTSNGSIQNDVAGAGKIVKSGVGTLDMRPNRTTGWTGDMDILGGKVIVDDNSAKGKINGDWGTTLEVTSTSAYLAPFYVTGGMNVDVKAGTILSNISMKDARNDLTGTLNIFDQSALYSTTEAKFANVNLMGQYSYFKYDQNFDGTSSNKFTGIGWIQKSGSGEATLTGDALKNFSGGIYTWSGSGALRLKNQKFSGDLYNYGTLIYDINDTQTWNANTLGNSTLIKDGTGTLNFDGDSFGGTFRVAKGTAQALNDGLAVGSQILVDQPGRLRMSGNDAFIRTGTLTNSGELSGNGRIDADLSNTVNGRVVVGANDTMLAQKYVRNFGIFQMTGGTFQADNKIENMAGGQISGRGTLRGGATGGLGLENSGSVAFSGGYSDVFGDVSNLAGGRLMSVGGATVTYHDDMIHNGAEIRTAAGSRTVFLGSVSGAGMFTGTGTVEMQGDLRPGNSPALVTFEGDLELGQTARTTMELGGLARGSQYDSLRIMGTGYMGGTLDVKFINGFSAGMGDSFRLFEGDLSGQFDSILLPTLSGDLYWDTNNLYSQGSIMAVPEPASMAAMALGLVGIIARKRRKA